MVRTLSRPSPLSAIDPKRIAGNAAVVVVHALAFALLMLPARWDPPVRPMPIEVVVPEIIERTPPPPTLPPPPQPPQPIRQTPPQTTPPQVVRTDAPPVDTSPVLDQGEIQAEIVEDVGPPVNTFDPGPQLEQLGYLENPAPRYPRVSIRNGDEGQVLLRVFVDANGRPLEVTVERSSGHRELDRAAREQVLAQWRFQPAQRAGVAVPAWALVPIDFRLP
jgi:protein TonB